MRPHLELNQPSTMMNTKLAMKSEFKSVAVPFENHAMPCIEIFRVLQ